MNDYSDLDTLLDSLDEGEQLLKTAFLSKKADDYSFDELFSDSLWNKLYEDDISKNSSFVFYKFEEALEYLYQYFHYSKRYIVSFENTALEHYKKMIENADQSINPAEEEQYYDDKMLHYGETITLHSEAVLLILYSTFERFLRDCIKETDEEATVLRNPFGDHTVTDYLKHLKQHNVFVPNTLYESLTEIRKVRNHIVHNKSEIDPWLLRRLKYNNSSILKNGELILNYDYVEYAFHIIAKIVSCIETYYQKDY